ncbi:ORF6N domain-containing protein [Daejeonella sp.]|uniref:ORF6N domain-containing protein n=1 Tax=Daejeonella sp. TaxID=2805397 RepID=UPI0030BB5B26
MLRGQKVMLDRDLAELFGVKAIRLREQVKRNKGRFPDNFMFVLSDDEAVLMVSQFAIPSKQALGGALPFAFTEHGVLMLSNVLRSDRAMKMSIRIIEIFIKLRESLLLHKDLTVLINEIEKRMLKQDKKIDVLFDYLNKFIERRKVRISSIGFKRKNER